MFYELASLCESNLSNTDRTLDLFNRFSCFIDGSGQLIQATGKQDGRGYRRTVPEQVMNIMNELTC